MSDQIDESSLKEHLSEVNELKMKVRGKNNEEHDEIKIKINILKVQIHDNFIFNHKTNEFI